MRVLLGIALSLLIHLFLVWSAKFAPLIISQLYPPPIEVELIEEDPSQNEMNNRQIVTQVTPPPDMLDEDDQERMAYLSELRQRVKKQSQAALSGATENRSAAPSESEDPAPPQASTPRTSADPRRPGTLDAFLPKYRTMPPSPSSSRMGRGLSTIGDALPKDIEVGSFTALNTDQYLFYSFYSRINEMIRFRWENMVRNSIDSTPPDRLVYNPSGLWLTHLEIILSSKGEVLATNLMKSSGFRGFDQSAIQAFLDARVFQNPPAEMVEEDGRIRLKYSFQVRYEPKVLVKTRE